MPIRSTWRPFTKQSLKGVPEKAGVCELADSRKQVVYIGSSRTSIRARLLSHNEMKRFAPVKYFRYGLARVFQDAREMERDHCDLYKKHNKGLLPRLQRAAPNKL